MIWGLRSRTIWFEFLRLTRRSCDSGHDVNNHHDCDVNMMHEIVSVACCDSDRLRGSEKSDSLCRCACHQLQLDNGSLVEYVKEYGLWGVDERGLCRDEQAPCL